MAQHDKGEQIADQEQRSILINFVLDKSGSMSSIADATISGFNEFLGDQRVEGGDARITLTLFDTNFVTVAEAVPVAELPDLDHATYRPSGMTALYDAVAHTMRVTDDYYAEHKPDQVLFVIMTDGHENSSRQYTREQIFQMIADRQKLANYEFIYLGANQDSYDVGHGMGIRDGRMLDYDATPEMARATMRRVSANVKGYRRHGRKQLEDDEFFSEELESFGADAYEIHRQKMAAIEERERERRGRESGKRPQ